MVEKHCKVVLNFFWFKWKLREYKCDSPKKKKKKKNRGIDFRKQTEYAKNTVFCVWWIQYMV